MQKEKKDSILNKVGNRNVAVFGAGRIGNAVVRTLLQSGIKPVIIYDNNKLLWDENICGVPISRPVKPEGNVFVIIANKMDRGNIRKQIVDMGISQEQIAFPEDF